LSEAEKYDVTSGGAYNRLSFFIGKPILARTYLQTKFLQIDRQPVDARSNNRKAAFGKRRRKQQQGRDGRVLERLRFMPPLRHQHTQHRATCHLRGRRADEEVRPQDFRVPSPAGELS